MFGSPATRSCTPSASKLAKGGTVFAWVYVNGSVIVPNRSTILPAFMLSRSPGGQPAVAGLRPDEFMTGD